MKYSLCLEPLFEDIPFHERIEKVSEIGFNTIEFWDPGEKNREQLKKNCDKYGINISNCTVNDPWSEKRLHASEEDFVGNFKKTIPMLETLNCNTVIVLTGEVDENKSIQEQKDRIISNLQAVTEIAEREDIKIILEALNSPIDHPGYFLDSSKMGFEILKEVNHPQVKLLYDVYHMQIMEGNIIDTISENIDLIGHFHAAGVPRRHELFNGELNYKEIIKAIEQMGYDGYFGIEYFPALEDEQSLMEMKRFLEL